MTAKTEYTPRVGSKISLAVQALAEGPVSSEALAKIVCIPVNNASQLMKKAVDSGLVVKVQDSAGLLHFALPGMALDARFTPFQGRVLAQPDPASPSLPQTTIDAADPFGLVAKRTQQRPAAAPADVRPLESAPAQVNPAAPRIAPVPAAPADQPAAFVTALFSTGELMIKVGDDTVMLNQEHQKQLQQYCAKFED